MTPESGTGRMKAAIMQPYFFPYIGYFQLMAAVDVFVAYDNIKYTKKGWINRNRYLHNGFEAPFGIPLRKGSDHLDIVRRQLSADFDRPKLLAQLREAYRKAPHFADTYPLIEAVVGAEATNLFEFLLYGLTATRDHLGLRTPIVASSSIEADHSLRSQERVIAIAKSLGARTYINPIGGIDLYSRAAFAGAGLELRFLRPLPIEYAQTGGSFVPWLSIVDVLMFNGADRTQALLSEYELA